MPNAQGNMQFEDVSSYSSSKEYKKKKKNRRGRTVLKSILAIFSVILILGGSALIYASADLVPDINTKTITKDKNELMILENATTDDSITNIAMFGIDARDGSFDGLSDTIMILSVDNKHGKIKLTSILRDSKVTIAGYGENKINAAYSNIAYPQDGGPELAIKTLNYNFALNITDYVTINFGNMSTLVEAFGGSEVTMTDDEAYETNKNLNSLMYEQIHDGYERTIWESDFLPEVDGYVSGGTFLLNGNQAVAYARNRSDSDANRSERQKRVLIGMLSRVGTLSTKDYYTMVQELMPLCETSLDFTTILGLLPILTKNFTIETLTIPGAEEVAVGGNQGDDIGWVFQYDLDAAAHHIDRFIYEEGSPYWDASSGNGADHWDSATAGTGDISAGGTEDWNKGDTTGTENDGTGDELGIADDGNGEATDTEGWGSGE